MNHPTQNRGNLILQLSATLASQISEYPPIKWFAAQKKAVAQPEMNQTAKKRKHRSHGKGISVFLGRIYVDYSRATRSE